ncbi:MAG TPA: hypothetical protein DDX33_04805 [Rikenellaceae bacterium]|nr:hypothetical protein [Rikenellaceae bacterium]
MKDRLYAVWLLCVCAIVVSCSVKEDRAVCPVYVNLDFDGVIAGGKYVSSLVGAFDGTCYMESIDLLKYERTGYEVARKRGHLKLGAAFGFEGFSWKGDTLSVPPGAECSPLFAWAEKIIAEDDLYYAEVIPHKQYSVMNIIVVGLLPGDDFSFDIRVKANCNAFKLYELSALEGEYTVVAGHKNASGYEVIVPRQLRNEMVLELLEHSANHIYGKSDLLSTIDVGKLLEAKGFDWNKPDLDDMNVVVDFTRMQASVEVIGWTSSRIEITI